MQGLKKKRKNQRKKDKSDRRIQQEVLERTNPRTFLTLFNSAVSVALFNCSKLRIFFSMLTLLNMITVLKQWVHYCISIDSTITR
jgi:hypothetical protein